MTTKEEVLRLAEAAGFPVKRWASGVRIYAPLGADGISINENISMLIELAKQAGAAEEREACALWYEKFGYLLDEQDISDAIRNRAIKS